MAANGGRSRENPAPAPECFCASERADGCQRGLKGCLRAADQYAGGEDEGAAEDDLEGSTLLGQVSCRFL